MFDVINRDNILKESNSLENIAKYLTSIKIVMLLKWEVRLGFDICDVKLGFHDSMLFFIYNYSPSCLVEPRLASLTHVIDHHDDSLL